MENCFLYHSWCPSVPTSHDPANPLRGPRLKPKNSTNVFFIPFWWDWKLKYVVQLEYHFHPWKCFSSVFGGLGLCSNLKKKTKKNSFAIRFWWNQKHIKAKTPPSFSKCLSLAFRGLRLELKNGQNLKKCTLSGFDETENQRTHYSQNTTSTITKICHWCLEVLGSNSMDKVSKDLPLQIIIILKTKNFCLFIIVVFSLNSTPRPSGRCEAFLRVKVVFCP